MPDGTSSLFSVLFDGAKYVFVLFLGLLMWTAKRLHIRVDKIAEEYVPEHTYNETLKQLRDSMDKGFDQVRDDIKGIHSRIDNFVDKK